MDELFRSFLGMGLPFIISQAIGPVTTVLSLISTQMKNITAILLSQLVINLLVALSYILAGGISGSYICLVACVQTAVCYLYTRREKPVPKACTAAFILCYIAVSVYTYAGPADILPCICAIAFALSVSEKNAAGYRVFITVNTSLWIVYDILIGAWGMLLMHGILLFSLAVAILRQDRRPKPAQDTDTPPPANEPQAAARRHSC